MSMIAAVEKILWEDWDPICVNDEPKAEGEYRRYAMVVAGMLEQGVNRDELERYLVEVECDVIELSVPAVKRRRVIEKLLTLTKS